MTAMGLGFFAALVILGFWGAPLYLWSIVVLGGLYLLEYPIWFLVVVALPLLFCNIPSLRSAFISQRIAVFLKKLGMLPVISETEQVALEAGTVWVDGELFSGKPDIAELLAVKTPQLRADEQAFMDGPVEDVCRMVDDWQCWRDKDLPPELWRFPRGEGFLRVDRAPRTWRLWIHRQWLQCHHSQACFPFLRTVCDGDDSEFTGAC